MLESLSTDFFTAILAQANRLLLAASTGDVPEKISQLNFLLLLLGLALVGGTIGGRIFQRLKIPQVVGYIVIGIIIGPTVFNILTADLVKALNPFNNFALGLIGFMIGGELKKEVFVKYGKQFLYILLAEGVTAFIVVTLLIGFFAPFILPEFEHIWALALVLGAIASATAPAATTDVLWEYKTRGPLTRTVLAIVALDDGLALFLFAIASSLATMFVSDSSGGLLSSLMHPVVEIVGSLAIGIASGGLLTVVIRKYREEDRLLAFTIGAVLLVIGASLALDLDSLLAAMALGATTVNLAPRLSREAFQLVQRFTPPTYVLFFVLVGAHLEIKDVTWAIAGLIVLYLGGRTSGKMIGAWGGAKVARAPDSVRKYLPFCLFSQAGVAIGLAILVGNNEVFQGNIANIVVVIVVSSTFIVQLIGPPFVKFAVHRAGEVGLDITEEDIIKQSTAADLMNLDIPKINEDAPLPEIMKIFSNTTDLAYPVVSDAGNLLGMITVHEIRDTLQESELANFLLANDLMSPLPTTVAPSLPMPDVQRICLREDIDIVAVIGEDGAFLGLLDIREMHRRIARRLIKLQEKQADLG